MAFIPVDKMAKLREAARSGDEKAKAILMAQMNGEDFDLDGYFAPKPEPEPVMEAKASEYAMVEPHEETPFEMYLRENNLEDNEENRTEFEEMTGNKVALSEPEPVMEEENEEDPVEKELNKLAKEEIDAMDSYSKSITVIMSSDINSNLKRKIISRLEEIRDDEKEHHSELSKLLEISENDLQE